MHGLNQYDSKARMQEFQLPGFTTQDPLSENYYNWSPYGYCMGNPINRIDPDGRDIIVLNDPKGALGFGHAAMLIGNEQDGWQYISKDGAKGIVVSGPPDVGKEKYATIEEFNNSEDAKKYHGYQNRVRFATSSDQDAAAKTAMETATKSYYGVLSNNCIDAVSTALKAAGLNPGFTYLGIESPYADPVSDRTPIPNSRYGKIIKNNANMVVSKTENANNSQSKKKGTTWNELRNIIGSFLTANPQIVFSIR